MIKMKVITCMGQELKSSSSIEFILSDNINNNQQHHHHYHHYNYYYEEEVKEKGKLKRNNDNDDDNKSENSNRKVLNKENYRKTFNNNNNNNNKVKKISCEDSLVGVQVRPSKTMKLIEAKIETKCKDNLKKSQQQQRKRKRLYCCDNNNNKNISETGKGSSLASAHFNGMLRHRNIGSPNTTTNGPNEISRLSTTSSLSSLSSSSSSTLLSLSLSLPVVEESITNGETLTVTSDYDKTEATLVTESSIIATATTTTTTTILDKRQNRWEVIGCHHHVSSSVLSLLKSLVRAIAGETSTASIAATTASSTIGTTIKPSTNLCINKPNTTCSLTRTSSIKGGTNAATRNGSIIGRVFRNLPYRSEIVWLLPLVTLVAAFSCGHAGFACLSNPCIFGVCIDGLNSSYSCYCIDGYTGIQCQTNWDECWSGPCQNGGTCIDGVAYYNCTCPDGFSGVDCEENVDECMSNPCQNGGHCRDRNNGYTCTCAPGYLGDHCEIDVAVCEVGTGARCQNGGECVEGPGLEFSCDCAPGWHGRICQDEINECDSSPCQNGGVCVDKLANYVCACPMGYTGTNCEEEILICSDNPCENNALCLMEEGVPTCYCVPDYHGEKCESQYDECQLGPRCMNGGVCIDGVDTFSCSCPPLLTGLLCECLMIGEDSLDCNYTSTVTVTAPSVLSAKPSIWMTTTPKYFKAIPTGKVKYKGIFEVPIEEEETGEEETLKKAAEHERGGEEKGEKGEEESLEKPLPEIHHYSEEVMKPIVTTPKVYYSSATVWGEEDLSAPYTTETTIESGEDAAYSEVGSAEEQTISEEFTTAVHFDVGLSSEEMTTPHPKLLPHDFDYDHMTKYPEVAPTQDKDKSFPPTPPSYHKTPHISPTTSSDHIAMDYTTKRTSISDIEAGSPKYHSTIGFNYVTSKPDSESQHTTASQATKEGTWREKATQVTTKYMPPPTPKSRPGFLPTTVAPFFTAIPEVIVTTKYYDFKHKDKDKDKEYSESVTHRPYMPTYSVTTIGKPYDYDGPQITTSSPGITITVYSPENRTYLYHRPTPTPFYPPKFTTTTKPKPFSETTTTFYKHTPTTSTPKTQYHPSIYTTVGSPTSHPFYINGERHDQKIPAVQTTTIGSMLKTDYGIPIKTVYPETPTVTYTAPPTTYKPTSRLPLPTTATTIKSIPPPTTFKTVLHEQSTTHSMPDTVSTYVAHEQTTKAQQPPSPPPSSPSLPTPPIPALPQSIAPTAQVTQLPHNATTMPSLHSTHHPTETTLTSQMTLPGQQATLPLQPTTQHPIDLLPTTESTKSILTQTTKQPKSYTTYPPSAIYSSTHPTHSTHPNYPSYPSYPSYPTLVSKMQPTETLEPSEPSEPSEPLEPLDISEEEASANTVSPEVGPSAGIQPPSSSAGPPIGPATGSATESTGNCITMGCYNGGTCVTTSEGSRCVCRFDRQGALCEQPIIIKNAAFSGDSYVSHRIHKDITHHDSLDTILPMHVQLKVRTRATNGLIMLAAAQGTKGGHYMALFLQKGLLQFQFSCGLQTMLLSELETPVNTGHEITIRAELDFSRNYTHCNASLLVNETLAMSGDQPTWLKLLPTRMHTPDVILNTWLHLGGAPQAPIGLIIELPPSQSGTGFTGCLHSLRINEEIREIFGEALDGFSITECGSLACLSSPCRNGAACIKIETNELDENGDKIEKWKCKCPTGYMGATCEISVCEDNPCQYGGTCVQFPGSGYLCLCPLGKHGHYCEHNIEPPFTLFRDENFTDLEVALPSFSGSVNGLASYVAYTVPIPLEYSMELSFKILPQTMSQIALLAFLGQTGYHDEKSDHLAISFIQGYIMLTWNLGSGPRRIFTQKAIDFRLDAPRIPYEIKVGRIGRQAWLSVDGKFNITGRSPGTVSRMDVMPILYLGGHEIANFHTLPHDLPLHSGFQGCIYDVHLKAGQVMVPLQETRGVRGRGVGQCGTRECHRHACQHDGACLQHGATFTCICQEGWYGPLCAQPTNPCDSFNNKCSEEATCVPLVNGYECDCPVGKTGKNCEEGIHSLSDVSLTGRRSYLAVKWPDLQDSSDKLGSKRSQMFSYRNYTKKFMPPKPVTSANQHFVMKLLNEVEKQRSFAPIPLKSAYEEHRHRVQFFFIEFQLRPLSERGLLLYFGTLNNNQDKKIGFVSLSLQGGVVEFRISGPNSHVTVVRSVRMLAIGEWHKIKMAQRGRWLTLWVEGSASSALAPTAEVLVEPDSLLYIGGLKDLSKLPHNAISGFPMSFRGCVRGLVVSGTRIVLNETNIIESRNIRDCDGTACGGDSCEAGGHCWLDEKLQPHCICPEYAKGDRCEYSETCKLIPCKNNGRCLRSGRCSCPNGWGGFYCEIALIKPSTPSFRGNSYLVLPPPRIPMKDKRKGPSIYLRPREAIQVSLNFSSIEPNGLLLWSEQDATKFLGLGLENGHLKLASNLLGSINDTVSTPSGGFITDGSWHTVKVIVDRGHLELQLDDEVVFSEKLALMEHLISLTSTISPLPSRRSRMRSSFGGRKGRNDLSVTYENAFYLGGFPNLDSVTKRTRGRFSTPFKGCLQDVQFGTESNAIIRDFSKYHGENIGSCDLHGDEPIIV